MTKKTPLVSKKRSVLDLETVSKYWVFFGQDEISNILDLSRNDWEAMGSPETITITIEPGDLLQD
jgi:hypothetical protein